MNENHTNIRIWNIHCQHASGLFQTMSYDRLLLSKYLIFLL